MSLLRRIEQGQGIKPSLRENIKMTLNRMANHVPAGYVREDPIKLLGFRLDPFVATHDTLMLNETDRWQGWANEWERAQELDKEVFREVVSEIRGKMDPQIWAHYHGWNTVERVVHGLYANRGFEKLPAWWRVSPEDVSAIHGQAVNPGEIPYAMNADRTYGHASSIIKAGKTMPGNPVILVTDEREINDQFANSYAVRMGFGGLEGLVITSTGPSERVGNVTLDGAAGWNTLADLDRFAARQTWGPGVILVESLAEVVQANPKLLGSLLNAGNKSLWGGTGLMMTTTAGDFIKMSNSENRGLRRLIGMCDVAVGGCTDSIIPLDIAKVCAQRVGMNSSNLGELLLGVQSGQLAVMKQGSASLAWQLK